MGYALPIVESDANSSPLHAILRIVGTLDGFEKIERQYMLQGLATALGMHGGVEDIQWLEAQMDTLSQWGGGMYAELAGAYGTVGRSGDMIRIIRRCVEKQTHAFS